MARIGASKVQWGGAASRGGVSDEGAERDAAKDARDAGRMSDRPRRERRSKRIRMTANGPVRLTPTEAQIIEFIERHAGRPCSKAKIALALGRNEKTVDRMLSRMRREGIVLSEPVHAENGAQLANVYTVVDEVWPED